MRVVVHALGYRGDVLPLVPVAEELARRGHDVRFVTARDFHTTVRQAGATPVGAGYDMGPALLDQHATFVARWGTRLGGLLLPRLYFNRLVIPNIDAMFEAVDAEIAGADVVFSHPWSHLIAGPASERRGVSCVVGDVFPMLVPSRHMPPAGQMSFGTTGNRLAWALASSSLVNRVAFGAFRRLRARLRLPVAGWDLFSARLSTRRTIGLFSRHYQPRLPDWPSTYEVVGFTPWLGEGDAPADDDGGGEPPVLVTLGTNAASALPTLFVRAAHALDRAGGRGVFLTSNDELAAHVRGAIGGHHAVHAFAPLGPLLGRCRAVIHAGGHGTIAAVLTTGLPSAVRPAVTDQLWHAKRLEELGVGVTIERDRFDDAVQRLLHDRSLGENATALAERLTDEHGPRAAADLIEDAA